MNEAPIGDENKQSHICLHRTTYLNERSPDRGRKLITNTVPAAIINLNERSPDRGRKRDFVFYANDKTHLNERSPDRGRKLKEL